MQRRLALKSLMAGASGLVGQSFRSRRGWSQSSVNTTSEVRRVLVMFKCHFDAGFIDTQANVVAKYFKQYFPQAIEVAKRMRGGRR